MKQQLSLLLSGIYPLLLLLLMLSSYGCSVIGYSIGSAIDNSKTPVYEGRNIAQLRSGDKVRIVRRDSAVIEGIYKESESLDSSVYAAQYAEFLNRIPTAVNPPSLGDTLLLTIKDQVQKYVFLGFSANGLNVQRLPTNTNGILIYRSLSLMERRDGIPIDYNALRQMAANDLLPINECIVVESTRKELKIPLNELKDIGKLKPQDAKWTGLAVGLGLDALGVIVIIIAHNSLLFGGMNLQF